LESAPTIQPRSTADNIDFNKLRIIVKTNWVWIVSLFVVVNATAAIFIRYTKNVYESESQLKLDVKKDATELGIKNMMIEEQSNNNMVSGEIEVIQSKLFLNRVLDDSGLEVSFFSVGRMLNEELFQNLPATVKVLSKNHKLYNTPISFEEKNEKEFVLRLQKKKEVSGRYGEPVSIDGVDLVLKRNPVFTRGSEIGYFFTINSRESLLNYLAGNLIAEPLNYNANTIRISFKDYNPHKASAVLNKIDTFYLQYSNEQKNLANKQKIDWLTNELGQLERKMEAHENYFKSFTLQNKTSNLDDDLKQTIVAINKVDSQRYNYTRRVNELDILIDSINQGRFTYPISLRQYLPEFVISQLNALQQIQLEQDKLKLSYHEATFAYRQKQKELEAIKTKTFDQLTELKTEWQKTLRDLGTKKASLEQVFAALPDKSTEFTKNQRYYKLYEEFYLTLMQSKSEFEIAQAGSVPDFKILSPATFSTNPISPNRLLIAGAGFVASMVVIFFFVGVLYLLNNKITNLYELEKVPAVPVLGAVPLSKYRGGDSYLHVTSHPKSMVSEALRTLRTNLDFFNPTSKRKVIAVSSTVSGEGKSFIAMNLGGVIALSKKKVVLIDLDMRKAKASPVTGEDPSKGVSTVLIRKNTWQECVIRTSVENFDYMPAGPHPPNPSELLLHEEFSELLENLKKNYDFVILDTPPVGLVTDGIMAMKRADISVYVFRANYSKKEFLFNLNRIININKFSNITSLLNAVPAAGKTYGYGYYEEAKKSGRLKSIFKS
jgi:tyrosine-protein kinase Etk/Wzc